MPETIHPFTQFRAGKLIGVPSQNPVKAGFFPGKRPMTLLLKGSGSLKEAASLPFGNSADTRLIRAVVHDHEVVIAPARVLQKPF
jgi:hypothetical protein